MTYSEAREKALKSFRENETLYKEKLEEIEKASEKYAFLMKRAHPC